MRKEAKYKWTEEHRLKFHKIVLPFDKNMISVYMNEDKPFILTTVSKNHAIASILSQLNDENEKKIIRFVIRTLKESEIN